MQVFCYLENSMLLTSQAIKNNNKVKNWKVSFMLQDRKIKLWNSKNVECSYQILN